eukprot:606533-Rhodomonas_salina.1
MRCAVPAQRVLRPAYAMPGTDIALAYNAYNAAPLFPVLHATSNTTLGYLPTRLLRHLRYQLCFHSGTRPGGGAF